MINGLHIDKGLHPENLHVNDLLSSKYNLTVKMLKYIQYVKIMSHVL